MDFCAHAMKDLLCQVLEIPVLTSMNVPKYQILVEMEPVSTLLDHTDVDVIMVSKWLQITVVKTLMSAGPDTTFVETEDAKIQKVLLIIISIFNLNS